MHRFRLIAATLLGAFLFGLWVAVLPARAAGDDVVTIASKTGVHSFTVELARTEVERAKGLMFRKELAADHGMLFDFQKEQEVAFWMDNTYVSLDMIFIRSDGTIWRIEENTTPLSTRNVPSRGPVRGVLEVVAGTSRKLGIAPGDKVTHPIFAP
jgi:uncharacterized membrane protein (UPF0127 family)